jgi:hypothetical protein
VEYPTLVIKEYCEKEIKKRKRDHMPRTRRQTAKLTKKVVPIPPKYDTSLFQRKGDCIEGMPIPIFQFIQQFLNEQDYLTLMNSNLSTFQPIKYETVHYTLVGPEKWVHFDFCVDENKAATVLNIINSVKDKSKQIGMRILGASQPLILRFGHLFERIGKLTLEKTMFKMDFPLTIFNNIRHLKLSSTGLGLTHANFDLGHLETLELLHCGIEEIIAWNSSNSLKTLILLGCFKLKSIPPLDNIEDVYIHGASRLTHFRSSGNHKKFTFSGRTLDETTLLVMNQPSFYESLQNMRLCYHFTPSDFTFCQNIPVIDLNNNSRNSRNDCYPPLPVLNGKEIKLNHFSLSSWNGQVFSNVLKCELHDCIDLIYFPEMPVLQSLSLQECNQLVTIPSLLSLQNLKILACLQFKSIGLVPSLIGVNISGCPCFEDHYGIINT